MQDIWRITLLATVFIICTQYQYVVRAENLAPTAANGYWSTPLILLTLSVPAQMSAPVNVSQTPTTNVISWTALTTAAQMGNDIITSYQLQYSAKSPLVWIVLTPTPYITTTFTHTLSSGIFSAGATYYYQIKASNTVGFGAYSTSLSTIADNIPQGMNTPTASVVNPLNVTLIWMPLTDYQMTGRDPIILFGIDYYDPAIKGWTRITNTTLGTSLTFTHVSSSVFSGTIKYRMLAQNGVGWGTTYSNTLSVTADTYPNSMYAPTALSVTPTSITIQWQELLDSTMNGGDIPIYYSVYWYNFFTSLWVIQTNSSIGQKLTFNHTWASTGLTWLSNIFPPMSNQLYQVIPQNNVGFGQWVPTSSQAKLYTVSISTSDSTEVDPCTSYDDQITKQVCNTCLPGFALFLIGRTHIHCASIENSTKGIDLITGKPKCLMTNYIGQSAQDIALAMFVRKNESYLGSIIYYQSANESVYKSYCMNQNIYYLRPQVYNCSTAGNIISPSFCSSNTTLIDIGSISQTSVFLMMKIICFKCLSDGVYNSNAQLRLYPQFNIYAGDCIPQVDAESCITNSNLVAPKQSGCVFTSFNQTVNRVSTCVDCSTVYANCAACNSQGCTLCQQSFFWMENASYQYQQSQITPLRDSKCIFDTCTKGFCQNMDFRICEPKNQSTLQNCLRCSSKIGVQYCQMCKAGYTQSQNQTTCIQIPRSTLQLVYFVNSTTALYQKTYQKSSQPIQQCSNQVANFTTINSSDIENAAPFLIYAMQRVKEQGNSSLMINATIYLTKGTHFFFSCSGTEYTTMYQYTSGSNLFRYCIEYDLYRYFTDMNDNFNITIQALECSMKEYLGYKTGDHYETSFDSLCVNLARDPKPVIMVNNANTYFNVSGSLRVRNLKFSGINALAKPINSTKFDPSVFPQQYCFSTFEPQGVITAASPFSSYNNTCLQAVTGFSFTCVDPIQSIIIAPPTGSTSNQCEANTQNQYSTTQASSFTCQGEITNSNFFTSTLSPNSGALLYTARRKTLFNIYSFAEHTTIRNSTPELNIENCDFEYFLAAGYESLITIETNSLTQTTVPYNKILSNNIIYPNTRNYYTYNSADKGAKISIVNSTFKTSRFCKGLIVYRPAFYDGVSRGLVNYTNLYMTKPLKNNYDSFIIIKNSSFFNMNAFTQVTSLAITGYQQLKTQITSSIIDPITVPLFYNKGIIINVEDFGGLIEIVGCTFSKNSHYIPGILYQGNSAAALPIQMFQDSLVTKELQFTICDLTSQIDVQFFGGSTTMTTLGDPDLDSFFDSYERLGLIYISRNKAAVIVKDNSFMNNVGGTFGGAITINSPDWQNGRQPHVVIQNNQFQQNMAYFSGNAIYIRNTMLLGNITQKENCGGVNIINNYFLNNIGMKIHYGGAISAFCSYIQNIYHQDYWATSNYTFQTPQISSGAFSTLSLITLTSVADGQILIIHKMKFNLQGNYFNENYSGYKGSAIYIRQMSNIRIDTCIFVNNGPVYAVAEYEYSPYFKQYSGRPITFYDSNCVDEFLYLDQCFSNVQVTSYGGVQWSKVQGAVHVIFCEEAICLNSNTTQQLEISNSQFIKNFAGPVLDVTTSDTASQIFIRGGMNVAISGSEFFSNAGSAYTFSTQQVSSLTHYFPPNYLQYSMSPLINILMTPPSQVNFPVSMNFSIQSSKFYKNRNIQVLALSSSLQYFGSLIQMRNLALTTPLNQQTLNLTVQDCDFQENQFTGEQSSLIFTHEIVTSVIRSNFLNNGRITEFVYSQSSYNFKQFVQSSQFKFMSYQFNDIQSFGCIMIEGSQPHSINHQMVNNTFKLNFASQGVAYSLVAIDNQQLYIGGNTYSLMFAQNQGSLLYWSSNVMPATLLMERETAQFLFGMTNGAIKIDPTSMNQVGFILANSTFGNVYANLGQVLSLYQVGKTFIKNVTFNQPALKNNLTYLVMSQFTTLKMDSFISQGLFTSLLTDLQWLQGYIDMQYVQNPSSKNLTFKGVTYSNSPYVQYAEILNCNFLNNNVAQFAAIYASNSYVRIANSIPVSVSNNTVMSLGAFGFIGGSKVILQNLNFINNTSFATASTIYISSLSSGTISDTSFRNNFAAKSGTVLIEGDSSVNFTRCIFTENYAGDSGAVFIQNNPEVTVKFNLSQFIGNKAQTNLINLFNANAIFQSTIFLDNIAQSVNHGINFISSTGILNNVTVNYTDMAFVMNNKFAVDSGFFNLNYQSTLLVTNSHIENCRGALAAVFYVSGQSSLSIQNGTTIKTSISKVGSALLATMAKMVTVNNTAFIMNGQNDIQVTQTKVTITNSRFVQTQSTSVSISSSGVTLINNTFEDGLFLYNVYYGKALYCNCQGQTLIINNTFNSLSAVQGGALYLLTSSHSAGQSYSITGNTFKGNSAQQGGAIYLQDAVIVNLTGNLFIGNNASVVDSNNGLKAQAGAFFYACDQAVSNSCTVNIQGNNSFTSNSAFNDGGAIMWSRQRPLFLDNSTLFAGNTAFYGNDIASYPCSITLVFLSNGDYINPYNVSDPNFIRRALQQQYMPTLVSGNTINFNIYILDQDGNIYRTDSSSKAVIDKQDSSTSNVILLNNVVIANEGVYYFQQVQLIAVPGSEPALAFTFSGLQTFGNQVGFVDSPVKFAPAVRTCVAGESLSESKCAKCPPGTFQYAVPTSTTLCQPCPENAECYGQTSVAPLAGYWRSSNISSNFIQCPNPAACLGGSQVFPEGQCAEGYQGIVCGECAPNYSSPKQFTCEMCPDPTRNLVQTIGILLAAIIVVSFLVRSTLNSANKQKPVHAVYLKIMTNHIQILGAISNINYSWPSVIQNFEDQQDKVTSASGQVFSFDCFLMGKSGTQIPVFFEKLIMFGLLPVILFLVSLLFWKVVSMIQKKSFIAQIDKFISTLIIVLFLVHPNIAQMMFLAFNCVEIEGVYRMKQNVANVCYQGQHMYFMSLVAFPAIALWVLGIPLFALGVLIRNRKTLSLMTQKVITKEQKVEIETLKIKYGFLFSGYDARTFYWEVVIMYRKILIIAASVFLSTVSTEAQVLVVIFVIVVSMFLQVRLSPYYTPTLNQMENYSLQVAAVTVYTGMFYVTGVHYQYMSNQIISWFFLICIVLPNVVFLLYWFYNMRLEILKEFYRSSPLLFKIFACQSKEAFYEIHMKQEQLAAEVQKIVDDFTDININVNPDLTIDKSYDTQALVLDQNNNTGRTQQKSSKRAERFKKYEEQELTSRSYKVFPEPSISIDDFSAKIDQITSKKKVDNTEMSEEICVEDIELQPFEERKQRKAKDNFMETFAPRPKSNRDQFEKEDTFKSLESFSPSRGGPSTLETPKHGLKRFNNTNLGQALKNINKELRPKKAFAGLSTQSWSSKRRRNESQPRSVDSPKKELESVGLSGR